MDISLKYEDFKILVTDKDNSVEETVEAELSLPEYMPEILRVIKVSAEPQIVSCRLVGERVTVDGACRLLMIYTAEDGCIYSFSQTRQFTRHCEKTEFTDAIDWNANARVSYVNFRATGTKKAEIKAGINIQFNVYTQLVQQVLSIPAECKVEKKESHIEAFSLGCKKTKNFSMSDTVSLGTPAAYILGTRATAVITEIKKINNKLMLRGEAVGEISYVNSDNRAVVEHLIHSVPINQIVEVEGLEEHFEGSVTLSVNAFDVLPKGEHGSFITAVDLSFGIDACVTMWERKNYSIISDAYCTETPVKLEKKENKFLDSLCEIKDTYICDNTFTVSGEGVDSVVDSSGEISNLKISCKDGDLLLEGDLSVSLVIKDTASSFIELKKIFEFGYQKHIGVFQDSVYCEPQVSVLSVKCSAKNQNTIDVRGELLISGSVCGEVLINSVSQITEVDEPLHKPRLPVTVYFPEREEESLWDIARRYNTTVTAIAEENVLSGDTTEKLKVLFIPSA